MENLEENKNAAELASEAAFELEIANETRAFIRSLPASKAKKLSFKPIFIASIAASFLVIIASVITINISHNDHTLAGKYGINALVARSGNNIESDEFREAVKAYYSENYDKSKSLLEQVGQNGGKIKEYKEWLSLLIELQTSGSKSETFNNQLETIIANEDHEFRLQAIRIKKDLNLFWRKFVIK